MDDTVIIGSRDRERGLRELCEFAEKSLEALITMEEQQLEGPTSLSWFVRLDVAVWQYDTDKYCFYVNEVTRGLATGLFTGNVADNAWSMYADLVAMLPGLIDGFSPRPGLQVVGEEEEGLRSDREFSIEV